MPHQKKLSHGYLAAAATLLMWTSFSLTARMGGKSLLTPYDVFALRSMTATCLLLPFIRGLPSGIWRDQRLWVLSALSSLIYCPLVYNGFRYAPAAHGAILLSGLQPFLVSAIVWSLMGVRPNRLRLTGLSLITTGILCASVPYFTDASTDSLFGDFLIGLGSISWAFYAVLASKWGYSGWVLTRFIVFSSALIYLPIYFLLLPKHLLDAPFEVIAIQSISQGLIAPILAMLAYLKAISLLGTERSAALLSLVSILSGLIAVPLLDEPLTIYLLCGLVFVSLGSYIAARYASSIS